MKVSIVSGSAKIHVGEPSDDKVDLNNDEVRAKTWTGVVPTWTAYGEPISSTENRVAHVCLSSSLADSENLTNKQIPQHITDFVVKSNKVGETNAVGAVMGQTMQY